MAGINRALFENRHHAKASEFLGHPCIFLSHIAVDKPTAEDIATYIVAREHIDIYLDVNDRDLQAAANAGDAVGVTDFIECSLSNCAHIMCLVSGNTVRSWWVPYELVLLRNLGSRWRP